MDADGNLDQCRRQSHEQPRRARDRPAGRCGSELGTNRISEFVKQPSGSFIPKARVTAIGSGQGQISQPVDIEVKPSGNILVVERGNHRVQQLSQDGAYQAAFGAKGSGAGQLNEPTAIGVGQGGVVFVTDSGNHRVQRWQLE